MVTLGWEFEVPTCTTTGTADPAVTPAGICAFTWITPATVPGAPPAKFTVAGCPPMVTVTEATGTGSGAALINPSAARGVGLAGARDIELDVVADLGRDARHR